MSRDELTRELVRVNRELRRHGCPEETLTSDESVSFMSERDLEMLVRAEGRRLAVLRRAESESL